MATRFSTSISITADATSNPLRVEIDVPKQSKAWRQANAVFCPLGASPTRAWLIMLKSQVDQLQRNTSHTITWSQYLTTADSGAISDTVNLDFPGLYIITAERILHGAIDDPNALYQVELGDARYILGKNSASGEIVSNLRSYANQNSYLTGSTTYGTWTALVQALWTACGSLLGAYPGLPGALPIDGAPQNHWLVGMNAYRALCVVLDQLDCALRHDPTSNTYTIVQLGSSQTLPNNSATLKLDTQPLTLNATQSAAMLDVYFTKHYQSYGQERDTELATNWLLSGNYQKQSIATSISGSVGTVSLWDDLPILLDETNTQTNSAAVSDRLNNRKSRYATRFSVLNQHRLHRGLSNDYLPGGQVRAVLWRNWNDGVIEGNTNPTGGTVTEFVCCPQFVPVLTKTCNDGSEIWLDTQPNICESEQYAPPDFSRRTYCNYPRLPNIVQVNHTGKAAGEIVSPGGTYNLHKGRVKRWVANSMTTLDDCWILFVDEYDTKQGNIQVKQGAYYGPARLSGVSTDAESGGASETLPVYLVYGSEDLGEDFVVFQLVAAGSEPVLALAGEANAVICTLTGGVYVAGSTAIIVCDFYRTIGEWQGMVGCQGLAKKRSDGKYDIIFVQRPALITEATATTDLAGSSFNINTGTAYHYQQGNVTPPNIVAIHDEQSIYPYVLKGAKSLSIWNDRRSQLDVLVSQQQCLFATAKLNQAMTQADHTGIAITDFKAGSISPFNLIPDPAPSTVENNYRLTGENTDLIQLLFNKETSKWEIIQVDRYERNWEHVMVDTGSTSGSLHLPNFSSYYFTGKVVKPDSTDLSILQIGRPCYILFVDYGWSHGLSTTIIAEEGKVYGLAKWVGVIGGVPVYHAVMNVEEFECYKASSGTKGDVAAFTTVDCNGTDGPTITATLKYNSYIANKKAIVKRLNRKYVVNQVECG